MDGTDITAVDAVTFNPFDTIWDTNGATFTAKTGTDDTDVVDGLIAPGTWGASGFAVTNNSDVTASFEIEFTITNADALPIEFSVDGTTWVAAADIDDCKITVASLASGATSAAASNSLLWRWAFEGTSSTNFTMTQTDLTDTAFGTADTLATLEIEATITATQVD